MIRHRQQRERGREARAVALELERDVKAREAVVEERARIARELHDVVGHAISVMLLQAWLRLARKLARPDERMRCGLRFTENGRRPLTSWTLRSLSWEI